jgi:hypothetical protein
MQRFESCRPSQAEDNEPQEGDSKRADIHVSPINASFEQLKDLVTKAARVGVARPCV